MQRRKLVFNLPFECFFQNDDILMPESLQHADLTIGGFLNYFILVSWFLEFLNGHYTIERVISKH